MNLNITKVIYILASLLLLFAVLLGLNKILVSSSDTYKEFTEEIDQRDIDTGNAMNYLGDETSTDAVYEASQTVEHPPGKHAEPPGKHKSN